MAKPRGVTPEDIRKLIEQYSWEIKDFYLEHMQSLRIESEVPMPDNLRQELSKLCAIKYVQ